MREEYQTEEESIWEVEQNWADFHAECERLAEKYGLTEVQVEKVMNMTGHPSKVSEAEAVAKVKAQTDK